jgi:aspartate kinase
MVQRIRNLQKTMTPSGVVKMKVFKFGGASLETIQRIQNVAGILEDFAGDPLVVVVSAMGKTTNDLEKVVEHYYRRQRETAAQLLYSIQDRHLQIALKLLGNDEDPVFGQLRQLYHEMEWQLGEKPYQPYDYYYDQLVSRGELFSSLIACAFFNRAGLPARWLDVREVISTDDTFRDGRILWDATQKQMNARVKPLLVQHPLIITQGFIGATATGATTTLGREGSDYTAAVFANMLDAASLSIWKDVDGLKNADPRLFDDTINIDKVNYNEVIEMAYYGAQVIHPKTIKPLQNKKIPLYVKCFLDKNLPGTLIHAGAETIKLPPVIVLKQRQVLMTITTRDFSFITEENLSKLYTIFHDIRIKLNLMQNGAISFSCCIDQDAGKIERLIKTLHRDFRITYNEGLELLTVRHYENGIVEKLTHGKQVLLEQKSPLTIQRVLKG